MSDFLLLETDMASDLFKNRARAEVFEPLLYEKRLALAFVVEVPETP